MVAVHEAPHRRGALSTEQQSTIGAQRLTNYACAPMSEDDFVALVTAGQPSAPGYFVYDALLNRRRHPVLHRHHPARPRRGPRPAGRGRGRARRARAARVRGRAPAGIAQRPGRRSVRRDREHGDGTRGRAGGATGPRGRADRAAGSHRLRPRRRLPAREPEVAFRTASDRVDRAGRLTARQLATALIGPLPPVLLDVRNAGELAGGAIFHARHNARRAAGAARGDPATAAGRRVLRGRQPVQRGREPAAPSR